MNGFPHLANLIREMELIELKTRRENEKDAALRAELKDTTLSPENQAALDRGDRQRETGIYQSGEARPEDVEVFISDIQDAILAELYDDPEAYCQVCGSTWPEDDTPCPNCGAAPSTI